MVGVIAFQERLPIQTDELGARDRRAIDDPARSIRRSIQAVGAGAEYDHILHIFEFQSGSQSKFLIAATRAISTNRHGCLTARKQTSWPRQGLGSACQPLQQLRMSLCHNAAFSLYGFREHHNRVSKSSRTLTRSSESRSIVTDNDVLHALENRIRWFRRLGDLLSRASIQNVEGCGRQLVVEV